MTDAEAIGEPFRTALVDALRIADRLGLRVMLVGAFARELSLPVSVRSPARKTRDADLAVRIDSWDRLHEYFVACDERFTIERGELYMRHRQSGAKVDVVPCGPVEDPPGHIRLPGSVRDLNTMGLSEAFGSARSLILDGLSLAIPTPGAFILLKCLSFLDRRAPHDLTDLGSVLRRFPVDEDAVWADPVVMEGFGNRTLAWEDLNAWQLGRSIVATFSAEVRAEFLRALNKLAAEPQPTRLLLVEGHASTDERLEHADRQLEVLRRSIGSP
jgi:predicted nucleotidyltransferase